MMALGHGKGGRQAFKGDPQPKNTAWTPERRMLGKPMPAQLIFGTSTSSRKASRTAPVLGTGAAAPQPIWAPTPVDVSLPPLPVWAPGRGSLPPQLGPLGPWAAHPPRSLLFRPNRKEARPAFFLGGLSFSRPAERNRPLGSAREGPSSPGSMGGGTRSHPWRDPHVAEEPQSQGLLSQRSYSAAETTPSPPLSGSVYLGQGHQGQVRLGSPWCLGRPGQGPDGQGRASRAGVVGCSLYECLQASLGPQARWASDAHGERLKPHG